MDDCRLQTIYTRNNAKTWVKLKMKSNTICMFCFYSNRFLTVAEQMTTYYESADMTAILNNNSYWASYNNIYFPKSDEYIIFSKTSERYLFRLFSS